MEVHVMFCADVFLIFIVFGISNVYSIEGCKTADTLRNVLPLDAIHRDGRSLSKTNNSNSDMMLFDFTTIGNLDYWKESSDTVRDVGMSKASFVLQKTQQYQRAIFFALLNPQANGACFAGFRSQCDFASSDYEAIQLRLRGAQGDLWRYKILLTNQKDTYQRSYEAFFNVSDACQCKQTQGACQCEVDISLAMDDFKAYYRGKLDPDAPPLDSSNVVSFGIQAAGGVYEKDKQSEVGSIEIDWIKLVS